MALILSVVALGLAALPTLMFLINAPLFRRALAPLSQGSERISLSMLIPARNEEANIEASLGHALRTQDMELEVLVLDDGSTDRTAEIVAAMAEEDSRVRLLTGSPDGPPLGWNGKQYACAQLAKAARFPYLMFIDADVRLKPSAAGRLSRNFREHQLGLLSAFPHQETGTLLEKLLIPLMHLVLLGYLPFLGMRKTTKPSFSAGCGQLFFTSQEAYAQSGGHAQIKASRHDGVQLPRSYRRFGLRTDVLDGTDLAACRMYTSAADTWNGLAKNADEGLGSDISIWVWSLLLLGGHVLPWVMALALIGSSESLTLFGTEVLLSTLCFAAGLATLGLRLLCALRFRQSILGAVLHPLGVCLLTFLQWSAWRDRRLGRKIAWKGRT